MLDSEVLLLSHQLHPELLLLLGLVGILLFDLLHFLCVLLVLLLCGIDLANSLFDFLLLLLLFWFLLVRLARFLLHDFLFLLLQLHQHSFWFLLFGLLLCLLLWLISFLRFQHDVFNGPLQRPSLKTLFLHSEKQAESQLQLERIDEVLLPVNHEGPIGQTHSGRSRL